MQIILNRIYRERRRLFVVVLLAAVAGYLFYAHLPYKVGGFHIAWFSAGLYAGFVGISTLTICLVFPRFRFAMEAFALSRLIYACFVAGFPAIGAASVQEPLINATIVVAGGFAISLAFYSEWFARRFRMENAVATVRLREPLDPARALDLPADALERINYTEDGTTVRGALHALVTDASRDFRIDHDDQTGAPVLRIRHRALPLSSRFAAWIDDSYGRMIDIHLRAAPDDTAAPRPAALQKAAAA